MRMNINSSATSRDFAEALVINPYYAVQFHPGLFGKHKTISEDGWIEANRKLLAELGDERYLRLLLDTLKGVDPVTVHEKELADLFEMDEQRRLGTTETD